MRRLRRARVGGGCLLARAGSLAGVAGSIAGPAALPARCGWLGAACVCVQGVAIMEGHGIRVSRSGATFGFAVALLSGRPSFSGVLYALGAALVAYCEYSAHTRLVWSVGRSVVSCSVSFG